MIYDRRKLLPLTDTDFAGYKRERQQSRTKKQDDDDFFALLSWGLLGGSQGSTPAKAVPLTGQGSAGRIGHNSGAKVRLRIAPETPPPKKHNVVTKPIPTQRKLPNWWSHVLGETPTRKTDFGMAWPTLKPI